MIFLFAGTEKPLLTDRKSRGDAARLFLSDRETAVTAAARKPRRAMIKYAQDSRTNNV